MIKTVSAFAGYNKHTVLKNVSCSINNGEFVCIIGPNGSGKSTFLKALCGVIPLIGGDVEINGESVLKTDRKNIAKRITYLQQEHTGGNMTVGEYVLKGRYPYLTYPRRFSSHDKELAENAMKKLNIYELSALPLSSLSGGMKQNAYLARALCQDTNNILMDEPTTYLDVSNKIQLMRTLKQLAHNGKCVVAVLHDISLAIEYADRILLLNQGNLIADTTPDLIIDSQEFEKAFCVRIRKVSEGDSNAYGYELL